MAKRKALFDEGGPLEDMKWDAVRWRAAQKPRQHKDRFPTHKKPTYAKAATNGASARRQRPTPL
jgi:hypothetical protein